MNHKKELLWSLWVAQRFGSADERRKAAYGASSAPLHLLSSFFFASLALFVCFSRAINPKREVLKTGDLYLLFGHMDP